MAEQHSQSHAGSSGRMMQCSVVTPEATVLETSAKFVALPLSDGEMGIAPAHSPFIGRLGYGELRVEGSGPTKRYYVDGGFTAGPSILFETPEQERVFDNRYLGPSFTTGKSKPA